MGCNQISQTNYWCEVTKDLIYKTNGCICETWKPQQQQSSKLVTRSLTLVSFERGFISWVCMPKYEVSISYDSKVFAKVKVFLHRVTDLQSHWQTKSDGIKTRCPRFPFQWHKNYYLQFFPWIHQTIINLIHILSFVDFIHMSWVCNSFKHSLLSFNGDWVCIRLQSKGVAGSIPTGRHEFSLWIFRLCPVPHSSAKPIQMKPSMTLIHPE